MSNFTQKQECLVAYFCTPREIIKMNFTYNAQEDNLQIKDQIISEAVSYLKTNQNSKKIWRSIGVNTIKLERSHGQRLEDVISEDPLLTRLGILAPNTNGRTTETWITAYEEESLVNVYIKYQSDFFTMSRKTTKESKTILTSKWK